tara:strand:+ start:1579 stop:1776 length:198 start_codon:yes stop_codon:yes gene_type:complete
VIRIDLKSLSIFLQNELHQITTERMTDLKSMDNSRFSFTFNARSMRALGMEPKAQCKGRRCACIG